MENVSKFFKNFVEKNYRKLKKNSGLMKMFEKFTVLSKFCKNLQIIDNFLKNLDL